MPATLDPGIVQAIRNLAQLGMNKAQIATALGFKHRRVRGICERYRIPSGQTRRQPTVRYMYGTCGECGEPEVELTADSRLGAHAQLGPSRRAVLIAVPCPGVGGLPGRAKGGNRG